MGDVSLRRAQKSAPCLSLAENNSCNSWLQTRYLQVVLPPPPRVPCHVLEEWKVWRFKRPRKLSSVTSPKSGVNGILLRVENRLIFRRLNVGSIAPADSLVRRRSIQEKWKRRGENIVHKLIDMLVGSKTMLTNFVPGESSVWLPLFSESENCPVHHFIVWIYPTVLKPWKNYRN